ncbi:hypothetical protein T02_8890 [Trichinella nativa]|uniref:Uncharacterized protein n=1 Tax=Trichinella nativa TaxID=6335 RepID=A0A0V1L2Q8_9BILA|nr:hypothetical protein T02_8890 [Trichinella nativa]
MLKGRFRTTNCGSESSFTQGPINQEPDIRLNEENEAFSIRETVMNFVKPKYISIKVHHFFKVEFEK